jgi:phosphatidylglycerol---prolipoprotein diacylglyceryl transferase
MLVFLLAAIMMIARRNPWFMRNGFYALVGFYGVQRFVWEFLKPYGAVVGLFNVFHLVCAALACYALIMIGRNNERPSP